MNNKDSLRIHKESVAYADSMWNEQYNPHPHYYIKQGFYAGAKYELINDNDKEATITFIQYLNKHYIFAGNDSNNTAMYRVRDDWQLYSINDIYSGRPGQTE